METISWSKAIPVRFSFPQEVDRGEGWGRLTRLSSKTASLLSLSQFSIGKRAILYWELNGESFSVESRVLTVAREESGYFKAQLFFVRGTDRKRLATFLLDIISRSA